MRKLILAVDDDPKMLTLIKKMMSRESEHLILCQATPESALSIMDAINVDLFIIDVMMPNIDGIELCKRIRANDALKQTPIVMLSAKDNQKTRKQAQLAGADQFISKRDMRTLLTTVKNVINPQIAG